ncbi:uncharacterized protein AMSG_05400 [Thecamonas trahens ATCC 50062]|uniref:DUF4200 domain-containing protein n=1 Tax=Thecamonas trahens ATCC 50062 TaxID=461836 RepID=A0A0L0DAL3_THETB|nr:hypothetical protein AMSG_05400 [Thecamonas trahens ATCC 50062]KNC49399.1 hypothetical protein AMSG_05400 [Thecamonas trahens ATCC 50062]|eukprot:XP_013757823.1 hypothetical protein AMSG_05400 [Thecamonas trahens ATCC 50062]
MYSSRPNRSSASRERTRQAVLARTLRREGSGRRGSSGSSMRAMSDSGSSSDDAALADNPFALPDDVGVFTLAQVKRADKIAALRAAEQAKERARVRQERREAAEKAALRAQEEVEVQAKSTRDIVAKASASIRKQAGKENLREMIRNKREMFLIEFSLGVKRDEMRKLEEHAHAADSRIEHERKMLALEAQKWEEYTTYSTERVKAVQRQEAETLKLVESKEAQLRTVDEEIKDFTSRIQDQDEVIAKYQVLKEFLISLAPPEWVAAQYAAKRERQQRRREAKREARQARAARRAARKEAAAAARKQATSTIQGRSRANTLSLVLAPGFDSAGSGSGSGPDSGLALDDSDSGSDSGSSSDSASSSGLEIPMYFESPEQLLVVFHELEKSNLSLVNNSQEIEEALEHLRSKYSSVRDGLAGEINQLASRIAALDSDLGRERARIAAIQSRKAHFERSALQIDTAAGESADQQLQRLESRVRELYTKCCREPDEKGGGPAELHLRTVDMLTNFERSLRALMDEIRELDPKLVNTREKEMKKVRKKANRNRNMADLEQLWEARRAKHQDRVQRESGKRKIGRKLMRRSDPIIKRSRAKDEEDKKADRDFFNRYFFQE